MSNDFVALDKPLMVEIIRKRVYPGRITDMRMNKMSGGCHLKRRTLIYYLVEHVNNDK